MRLRARTSVARAAATQTRAHERRPRGCHSDVRAPVTYAAAAASATELHDGEGYPSASKTFAEPQEELEQQSALGPACDVASLARLLLELDVAALA